MRLYQSPDGVWTGTQADAKAHAKAANTTWKETEVPVDKAGLMAFLNAHKVGATGPVVFSAPSPAPCEFVEVEQPTAAVQPDKPQWVQTLNIEEALWELPLHEAIRLGGIVVERIREFAKTQ